MSDKHRAALACVEELTRSPDEVGKADMETMLATGWFQCDFYDTTLLASLVNFRNCCSTAFGVRLDNIIIRVMKELRKAPDFEDKIER